MFRKYNMINQPEETIADKGNFVLAPNRIHNVLNMAHFCVFPLRRLDLHKSFLNRQHRYAVTANHLYRSYNSPKS